MKIISFKAKNIWGYINHDIHFDQKLSFLIGINGCGKTSVIRLMNGLIEPSISELLSIEYESVTIKLESEKDVITISSIKENGNLSYNVAIGGTNTSFVISDDEKPINTNSEDYQKIEMQFKKSQAFDIVRSRVKAVSLGINRNPNKSTFDDWFERRSLLLRRFDRMGLNSVDDMLQYLQTLCFEINRDITNRQSKQINQYRNDIIKQSLEIVSIKDIGKHLNFENEKTVLADQKNKFAEALEGLGIKDINDFVEDYYKKLNGILSYVSSVLQNKDKISSVEDHSELSTSLTDWFFNCVQLQRVDKIIDIGKKYQDNIQKLREPFTRLENSIELFFSEGGKFIKVNQNGEIKVLIKYSNTTKHHISDIYNLSSGEKQLVLMFGMLSLIESKKQPEIFIIDEPELSLHIAWQERFADALQIASPNTQFILATHAPSIIAKSERRKNCIDLTLDKEPKWQD